MSKKTENAVTRTDLEVNDAVFTMADILKNHATIDATGGISVSKDAHNQLLEAGGLTPADQKKNQEFNSHLNAATTLAGVELGMPHLAKHADLKEVTIVVNNGRDQISAVVSRETTTRNPANGETSIVHGAVRGKYRTFGTANSRGDLKKVGDYSKRLADSLL